MVADPGVFRDLAYVFVAAVVGGGLARLARQPLILGYVFAGILVGPLTPGPAVSDVHNFEVMAEIGVALLMFSIGIELSLKDLLAVRRLALVGAPLGLAAFIGLTTAVALALGWSVVAGVSLGMGALRPKHHGGGAPAHGPRRDGLAPRAADARDPAGRGPRGGGPDRPAPNARRPRHGGPGGDREGPRHRGADPRPLLRPRAPGGPAPPARRGAHAQRRAVPLRRARGGPRDGRAHAGRGALAGTRRLPRGPRHQRVGLRARHAGAAPAAAGHLCRALLRHDGHSARPGARLRQPGTPRRPRGAGRARQ